VLLSLALAGRLKIDRASAEIRAVNDLFFGALDPDSFRALSAAAGELVEGSRAAMNFLGAVGDKRAASLRAAG
jgi:hypothetical protein